MSSRLLVFRWGARTAALLGAAIAACLLLLVTGRAPVVVQAQGQMSQEAQQAVVGEPTVYQPVESATMAQPTAAQRAASEAFMEMSRKAWLARGRDVPANLSAQPAAPAPASETVAGAVQPQAPGSFVMRKLMPLNGITTGSSTINEPSVAIAGKNIWATGNWWAARSKNYASGTTPWIYINPYADMPDFCCDQDVIYDKGRSIFLWYRQGVVSGSQNRFRLSVAKAAGPVCNYDFSPSGLGLSNRWWDYPRLALSNNYLYIETNLFVTGGGFDRHVLLKWPLDALKGCAGFGFSFWYPPAGWTPAPIENATETMYLGDNPVIGNPNTLFRVLYQPESSGTLFWVDRTIAAYTFTQGNASCPVLGGWNPCARADQRVVGGVLAKGQLDFYWNVAQGGGFAKPYTESAGFDTATLSYNARKILWNPGYTWFYASAGANDRDHVALSALFFNPAENPSHHVLVDDDYNGTPPGWEDHFIRGSAVNWGSNASGDYTRVRSHHPQGVSWIASGYTRQSTGVIPHVVTFGRERDLLGIARFEKK